MHNLDTILEILTFNTSDLLDTNIVSFAIKNNLVIKERLEELRSQKELISISCITYFEVKK
ncbi:hypothetical protein PN463_12630 [Dolichospermum circinale CS-537/03]|uniref:hypothetical protein n=1 Tax=Dolichospermum circinale TaxID=109265 RepID=UPI00054D8476|nr:hypothetical protein [Dolichospermum circinale]MDB9479460.1 hypothetical protein [Dolichospermum circinale CS-537/03]